MWYFPVLVGQVPYGTDVPVTFSYLLHGVMNAFYFWFTCDQCGFGSESFQPSDFTSTLKMKAGSSKYRYGYSLYSFYGYLYRHAKIKNESRILILYVCVSGGHDEGWWGRTCAPPTGLLLSLSAGPHHTAADLPGGGPSGSIPASCVRLLPPLHGGRGSAGRPNHQGAALFK